MMGSTYVSDPRVWKSFYRNMMDGQFRPGKYRGRQTGGGIGGMFSKKPYMIPVTPNLTSTEYPDKKVVGKHVTPMAAVEERAKSELNDAIKDKIPHVSEKTIKVGKRQERIKPKSAVKTTTSKSVKRKKLEEEEDWEGTIFKKLKK